MSASQEPEAPQIAQTCPVCGANVTSYRNWSMRGRGTHRVRIYAFRCDCGHRFRVAGRAHD